MRYDDKCARWHARRSSLPPPWAARLAASLRRRTAARAHGRHPRFRVVPVLLGPPPLAGAGGPRRAVIRTCVPLWPESVRAGLRNNRAPAIICMRIHQHPLHVHVRSHVPVSRSARSIRTYVRAHTSISYAPTGLPNSISNQHCAWACACAQAFRKQPGPWARAAAQAPGAPVHVAKLR